MIAVDLHADTMIFVSALICMYACPQEHTCENMHARIKLAHV